MACLHGSEGPQVGEITRLGGVTRQSTYSLILIWSRLHDRWGDPPKRVALSAGVKFCHVNLSRWGNRPTRSRIRDASNSLWRWRCIIITALFTNMQIVKFKSQLTIAFFTAVNHLNGPLRKQDFTLTGSKGHCFWFVIGGFRSVLCVSVSIKVRCLWSWLWLTAARNAIVKATL